MTYISRLDWDSKFFGFVIGRAELDPTTEIDEVELEATQLGVACLYAYVSEFTDPSYGWRLQERGFRQVEATIELEAGTERAQSSNLPRAREGSVADLASVEAAIDRVVPWSRFSADPYFGVDETRRLYHAWLRRAAEQSDELLAITGRETSIGFVTVDSAPTPRIGLMSVSRPGSGLGASLVREAKRWSADYAPVVHTAIQARNVAALRFFANHGFRPVGTKYVFHRWLMTP